jgi:SAM-dependent methyltransferase
MDSRISSLDIENLEIIRRTVDELISSLKSEFDRKEFLLLDVAPQDHAGLRGKFSYAQIKTLDIDPKSKADYIADLCNNNEKIIPSGKFDMVLCSEVLEHTLTPWLAVEELHRILKPGGLAAITTPFNFRIHGPLPDCWRFSRYGLEALFKKFSKVEIKEVESIDGRFLFPVQYVTLSIK